MSNRILKRHKRQVTRARERVRLSEPDLRTPEQLKAARDASRSADGRRNAPPAPYLTPPTHNHTGPAADTAPKAEA
jgi:hypothetical protein